MTQPTDEQIAQAQAAWEAMNPQEKAFAALGVVLQAASVVTHLPEGVSEEDASAALAYLHAVVHEATDVVDEAQKAATQPETDQAYGLYL